VAFGHLAVLVAFKIQHIFGFEEGFVHVQPPAAPPVNGLGPGGGLGPRNGISSAASILLLLSPASHSVSWQQPSREEEKISSDNQQFNDLTIQLSTFKM
jgi:hypothetical protein